MVKARTKKVTWTPHNIKRMVWEKLPQELTEELIEYVKANAPNPPPNLVLHHLVPLRPPKVHPP